MTDEKETVATEDTSKSPVDFKDDWIQDQIRKSRLKKKKRKK